MKNIILSDNNEQINNGMTIIELLLQKGANIDVQDVNKKASLNLEDSSQIQVCVSLLRVIAKYKPEDVKEFL